METTEKRNITESLLAYCERFGSQNKAANSMKGVSSATISQILNGNWDLITDDMWRNIASQIDFNRKKWAAVGTSLYKKVTAILDDARINSLVMPIIDDAGTGKTFALKRYAMENKRVYHLSCSEFWNKRAFLAELLASMGRNYAGGNILEMMNEAVRVLKKQDSPLLIIDEADKLSDAVLYFFITLYNQLEDECGIVICATGYFEKRMSRGLRLKKKGYEEIWSRLGRKCIYLGGVNANDIAAICEANGVTSAKDIDYVISESEGDLRRVKRLTHAILKKRSLKAVEAN
jgi:DNA transposition AAA+ family ATPase